MSDFAKENEELLTALQEPCGNDKNQKQEPKRGSKDELIEKIFQICDETNLICQYTKTDLRRQTKKVLQKTLAEYIEKGMRAKIKQKAGVESIQGASQLREDQLIAVGTLRLMHDSLATLCERGVDSFTPYSIGGFSRSLRNPEIKEDLDQCLLEIAREMDIMEHINSPYIKLGMIWTSGVARTLRKKTGRQNFDINKEDVHLRSVEPREPG